MFDLFLYVVGCACAWVLGAHCGWRACERHNDGQVSDAEG